MRKIIAEQVDSGLPRGPVAASAPCLCLPSGARVSVDLSSGEERVVVHDQSGMLLIEFDPVTRKTRLTLPVGDLELQSSGDINLAAAGKIRLQSDEAVELAAGGPAHLSIDKDALRFAAPRAELSAQEASVFFEDTRFAGERLRAKLDDVRVLTARLETVAQTARTQVKNAYQHIEGVWHTHAGRVRMLVKDAVHLHGDMLFFKAERDAKIKGEKIHLG